MASNKQSVLSALTLSSTASQPTHLQAGAYTFKQDALNEISE